MRTELGSVPNVWIAKGISDECVLDAFDLSDALIPYMGGATRIDGHI